MSRTAWVLIGIHGVNEFTTQRVKKFWFEKPTFADLLTSKFSFNEIDDLLAGKTIIKMSRWYLKEIKSGEEIYE